ncbi:AbrB/MazE/SpoVT family DNA-binding domain-containing protein [Halalkalicoccus salilacus]
MRKTVPVRSNGRIVVPSHLRDRFGIENGDFVEIDIRRVKEEKR